MKINLLAIRQSLRTLSAGIFAIIVARYFPSPESYWMILSACLIVQVRVGDIFKQHILSQLVTGLLAALLVFVSSLLGKNFFIYAIIIALTSLISVYVGFRWRYLFFAAYLVNLFTMIAGGMPVDLQVAALRRQYVVVGMVIAMGTTVSCWPSYLSFAIRDAIHHCRQIYKKSLTLIFSVYLMHDYLPNYLDYEKKIYQLSQEFFYWIQVLSRLSQRKSRKKICIKKMEHIFELVMALGLLRYRIKDHTTFEVIDQELKNVLSSLDKKIDKPHQANDINEHIEQLEQVYRSALQVVAQEPLVFLFFVRNLRALAQELEYAF